MSQLQAEWPWWSWVCCAIAVWLCLLLGATAAAHTRTRLQMGDRRASTLDVALKGPCPNLHLKSGEEIATIVVTQVMPPLT